MNIAIMIIDRMIRMRWVQYLIAFLFRTFVTDCPHCHQFFFGFQPYKEQVKIGSVNYRIVCHRCVEQTDQVLLGELNEQQQLL